LKSAQNELNDIKAKFENSTVFIHHSCKANSLLKEEKDSLDKILQDNALKLESLKKGYDELLEKHNNIEMLYNDTNAEKDLAYKKLNEIKNLNEIISNEKENCFKVLFMINTFYFFFLNMNFKKAMQSAKNELNGLQVNYKTLNKKFNQTVSEKDNQIYQLQQSVQCKYFWAFRFKNNE